MCDPVSSIFSLFSFFFFQKKNHRYRLYIFREMRPKFKKVRRQPCSNENFEANATNRVFIVQKLNSVKGHEWKNSFLGKNGRKMDLIYIYFFNIFFLNFLNKTEQSIFCRGIIEELFSTTSGSP